MIERRCRARLGDGFPFERTLRVRVRRFLMRLAVGRSRFKQCRVSRVFVGRLKKALADFVIRDLPRQALGPVGLKSIMPDL